MDRHWEIKRQLSNDVSDTLLDTKYKNLKIFGHRG